MFIKCFATLSLNSKFFCVLAIILSSVTETSFIFDNNKGQFDNTVMHKHILRNDLGLSISQYYSHKIPHYGYSIIHCGTVCRICLRPVRCLEGHKYYILSLGRR